ncbi:unnamed protein product [Amoebophrya sp. A25]|nr:unnamed protein product [Amoebophrya sp. A25]|eukprot:GSA25T00026804001.1
MTSLDDGGATPVGFAPCRVDGRTQTREAYSTLIRENTRLFEKDLTEVCDDMHEWLSGPVREEREYVDQHKKRREGGLLTLIPLLHIVDSAMKKAVARSQAEGRRTAETISHHVPKWVTAAIKFTPEKQFSDRIVSLVSKWLKQNWFMHDAKKLVQVVKLCTPEKTDLSHCVHEKVLAMTSVEVVGAEEHAPALAANTATAAADQGPGGGGGGVVIATGNLIAEAQNAEELRLMREEISRLRAEMQHQQRPRSRSRRGSPRRAGGRDRDSRGRGGGGRRRSPRGDSRDRNRQKTRDRDDKLHDSRVLETGRDAMRKGESDSANKPSLFTTAPAATATGTKRLILPAKAPSAAALLAGRKVYPSAQDGVSANVNVRRGSGDGQWAWEQPPPATAGAWSDVPEGTLLTARKEDAEGEEAMDLGGVEMDIVPPPSHVRPPTAAPLAAVQSAYAASKGLTPQLVSSTSSSSFSAPKGSLGTQLPGNFGGADSMGALGAGKGAGMAAGNVGKGVVNNFFNKNSNSLMNLNTANNMMVTNSMMPNTNMTMNNMSTTSTQSALPYGATPYPGGGHTSGSGFQQFGQPSYLNSKGSNINMSFPSYPSPSQSYSGAPGINNTWPAIGTQQGPYNSTASYASGYNNFLPQPPNTSHLNYHLARVPQVIGPPSSLGTTNNLSGDSSSSASAVAAAIGMSQRSGLPPCTAKAVPKAAVSPRTGVLVVAAKSKSTSFGGLTQAPAKSPAGPAISRIRPPLAADEPERWLCSACGFSNIAEVATTHCKKCEQRRALVELKDPKAGVDVPRATFEGGDAEDVRKEVDEEMEYLMIQEHQKRLEEEAEAKVAADMQRIEEEGRQQQSTTIHDEQGEANMEIDVENEDVIVRPSAVTGGGHYNLQTTGYQQYNDVYNYNSGNGSSMTSNYNNNMRGQHQSGAGGSWVPPQGRPSPPPPPPPPGSSDPWQLGSRAPVRAAADGWSTSSGGARAAVGLPVGLPLPSGDKVDLLSSSKNEPASSSSSTTNIKPRGTPTADGRIILPPKAGSGRKPTTAPDTYIYRSPRPGRADDRDRERDRAQERDRPQRSRERDRDHRSRERNRERERDREKAAAGVDRDREKGTDRDRERGNDRERGGDRDRERGTDRDREKERETREKNRDRERDAPRDRTRNRSRERGKTSREDEVVDRDERPRERDRERHNVDQEKRSREEHPRSAVHSDDPAPITSSKEDAPIRSTKDRSKKDKDAEQGNKQRIEMRQIEVRPVGSGDERVMERVDSRHKQPKSSVARASPVRSTSKDDPGVSGKVVVANGSPQVSPEITSARSVDIKGQKVFDPAPAAPPVVVVAAHNSSSPASHPSPQTAVATSKHKTSSTNIADLTVESRTSSNKSSAAVAAHVQASSSPNHSALPSPNKLPAVYQIFSSTSTSSKNNNSSTKTSNSTKRPKEKPSNDFDMFQLDDHATNKSGTSNCAVSSSGSSAKVVKHSNSHGIEHSSSSGTLGHGQDKLQAKVEMKESTSLRDNGGGRDSGGGNADKKGATTTTSKSVKRHHEVDPQRVLKGVTEKVSKSHRDHRGRTSSRTDDRDYVYDNGSLEEHNNKQCSRQPSTTTMIVTMAKMEDKLRESSVNEEQAHREAEAYLERRKRQREEQEKRARAMSLASEGDAGDVAPKANSSNPPPRFKIEDLEENFPTGDEKRQNTRSSDRGGGASRRRHKHNRSSDRDRRDDMMRSPNKAGGGREKKSSRENKSRGDRDRDRDRHIVAEEDDRNYGNDSLARRDRTRNRDRDRTRREIDDDVPPSTDNIVRVTMADSRRRVDEHGTRKPAARWQPSDDDDDEYVCNADGQHSTKASKTRRIQRRPSPAQSSVPSFDEASEPKSSPVLDSPALVDLELQARGRDRDFRGHERAPSASASDDRHVPQQGSSGSGRGGNLEYISSVDLDLRTRREAKHDRDHDRQSYDVRDDIKQSSKAVSSNSSNANSTNGTGVKLTRRKQKRPKSSADQNLHDEADAEKSRSEGESQELFITGTSARGQQRRASPPPRRSPRRGSPRRASPPRNSPPRNSPRRNSRPRKSPPRESPSRTVVNLVSRREKEIRKQNLGREARPKAPALLPPQGSSTSDSEEASDAPPERKDIQSIVDYGDL